MKTLYNILLSNKQTARKEQDWKMIDLINLIIGEAQRKQRNLKQELTNQEIHSTIKALMKATEFTRKIVLEADEGANTSNYDEELQALSEYLPKLINEEDTKVLVADAISKVGATSMKHIGAIMGYVKKTGIPVDMKLVNIIIKQSS